MQSLQDHQSPEKNATECEMGCPIHSAMRPIRRWVAWLAAMVTATSIYSIPCEYDESFCGVWGCFPPLMALISLHLLWFIALAAVLHETYVRKRDYLFPAGLILTGISAIATSMVLGLDLRNWLIKSPSEYGIFWFNRLAYRAITFTDAPLVEGILIGLITIGLGSRSRTTKASDAASNGK